MKPVHDAQAVFSSQTDPRADRKVNDNLPWPCPQSSEQSLAVQVAEAVVARTLTDRAKQLGLWLQQKTAVCFDLINRRTAGPVVDMDC